MQYGPIGEDMAGKSKKNPLAALMAVPGIGKATAEKLNKAGIKTPAGMKKAGKKGLEKAGISASLIKKLLASTPKKATPKKKAAAKKVAPKKKAAAKKAAPKKKAAAKKVAPKKKAAPKKAAPKKKSAKSSDGRKGRDLKVPTLAEMLKQLKSKR